MALLIIVGNPRVLASDVHWRALLDSCVQRGAYRGIPVRSLDSDTSLIQQAQSLLLTGDEREEEEEPSERMAQEHLEIQRYGE